MTHNCPKLEKYFFPGIPGGVGGGGFPAPPRKIDQSRGEMVGQNKGNILKPFQNRKLMMEQYCNTENAQSSLLTR